MIVLLVSSLDRSTALREHKVTADREPKHDMCRVRNRS